MSRRLPLLRLVFVLLFMLVLVTVLLLVFVRIDRVVVAPGRLEGATSPVRAPRAGRLEAWLVAPDDTVTVGTPLARLASERLRIERDGTATGLDALRRRITALRAERETHVHELQPEARRAVRREIERAELEHERASARRRVLGDLQAQGLAGALEVEEATIEVRVREVALREARAQEASLGARSSTELGRLDAEIAAIDAQIAGEEAAVRRLDREVEHSEVLAPRAGVVRIDRPTEWLGATLVEGDEVLRLSTSQPTRFRGRLSEAGQARVAPGQPVRIRLTAYPWLLHGTLSGRVVSVSDSHSDEPGLPVLVALDDDDPPGALREGMTGKARVIVESGVSPGRLLLERLARLGRP